jgi:hypothetical protein
VKIRIISRKGRPSISIQASPINFAIWAMRRPNFWWCYILLDSISDFACPPNLPPPKRFVQAGKFCGRRGMRLPATGREFGLKFQFSV